MELRESLQEALPRGELVLHHEPVVDLRTGRVLAVEALPRWRHPKQGLLGPDDWLDVAEEAGLLTDIGAWVLSEATRSGALLGPASAVGVRVDVSASQLLAGGLPDLVARALADAGLPAQRLVLEVPEGRLVAVRSGLLADLAALRELGVRLCAGGVGSGGASLTQVAELPVDQVKVHPSLVRGIGTDRGRAVVRALVTMGRELGFEVVAEAVETDEQAALLRRAGCTGGQGPLWGAPLSTEELLERLRGPRRGLGGGAGERTRRGA